MTDDWQQNHELREMANAGYGDLRTAIDPNFTGVPDTRSAEECIRTGFELIANGEEIPLSELLPHQIAMLEADKIKDAAGRVEAMRGALSTLLKAQGLPSDEEVDREVAAALAAIALSV